MLAVGTLRDWEQARKPPDAPALAYLRVISGEPEIAARALEAAENSLIRLARRDGGGETSIDTAGTGITFASR
jgi:hypothetical protein